jgi:hypothetical protein
MIGNAEPELKHFRRGVAATDKLKFFMKGKKGFVILFKEIIQSKN